jgi:hypothetical protein
MSSVFRIRNAKNQLQINAENMVPQFVGKITAYDNGIRAGGLETGFQTRSYSGVAPNFSGRFVCVYWALPADVRWYIPSPFLSAGSSGAPNIGLFAICPPEQVISGVPEGYVFALNGVLHSNVQPALRTWRSGGGPLTFDSGSLHLAVHSIADNVSYPYDADRNTGITLPTKAGILVPHVVRQSEQFDGRLARPDLISTRREWAGVVLRTGNALLTRFFQTANGDAPATDGSSRGGYSVDQTFGNTSGLIMPVINAALYD